MTTPVEVANRLTLAADGIRLCGWVAGEVASPEGRMCATGAVLYGLNPPALGRTTVPFGALEEDGTADAAIVALATYLTGPSGVIDHSCEEWAVDTVTRWNDFSAFGQADAIDVIRAASLWTSTLDMVPLRPEGCDQCSA